MTQIIQGSSLARWGTVLCLVACGSGSGAGAGAGAVAERDRAALSLSAEGVGPFRLGMAGAAALAMKGAERAEPDCPCAYNVIFADVGITVQINEGGEVACGIRIDNPAAVGVTSDPAALVARHGAIQVEPATGDVRFAGAPWLAATIAPPPGDDNTLPAGAVVRALLVGGCGE